MRGLRVTGREALWRKCYCAFWSDVVGCGNVVRFCVVRLVLINLRLLAHLSYLDFEQCFRFIKAKVSVRNSSSRVRHITKNFLRM